MSSFFFVLWSKSLYYTKAISLYDCMIGRKHYYSSSWVCTLLDIVQPILSLTFPPCIPWSPAPVFPITAQPRNTGVLKSPISVPRHEQWYGTRANTSSKLGHSWLDSGSDPRMVSEWVISYLEVGYIRVIVITHWSKNFQRNILLGASNFNYLEPIPIFDGSNPLKHSKDQTGLKLASPSKGNPSGPPCTPMADHPHIQPVFPRHLKDRRMALPFLISDVRSMRSYVTNCFRSRPRRKKNG